MSNVINLHFLPTRIKSDRWEVSVEAVHIHQREVVILCESFIQWVSLYDLPSAILLISQMLSYLIATWSQEKLVPIWSNEGDEVELCMISYKQSCKKKNTALVQTLTFIRFHTKQVVSIKPHCCVVVGQDICTANFIKNLLFIWSELQCIYDQSVRMI